MINSLFNQLPPHDAVAESAAIGSLMLADDAGRRELLVMLDARHFYVDQHAKVWAAIAALAARGSALDAVTVRAELHARGEINDVGGPATLADMLQSVPSAASARHYASIVLDHARRRSLVQIGYETATEAMDAGCNPIELAGRHRDRLDRLLRKAATPLHREGGAAEVAAIIRAEADGLRQAESLPWKLMARLTKCLLPGSITLLVGDPGAGKTFLLMEALNHWTMAGTPAAAMVLEKDRAWHLRRCLALLTQDLRTLDDDSVRQRAEWYTSRPGEHAETLDAIGRCVWDSTHCGSTLDELAAWIDQRADAGERLLMVDPVSLADNDEKPWIAHDKFMRVVRRSIERTGASLILATHPRGGVKSGPPTQDDLAGSRVFVRRADCILWLRGFPMRLARCVDGLASDANEARHHVDRTIRVLKARDGSAAGLDFGLQWHKTQGGFIERGIVAEWLTNEEADSGLPDGL